MNPRCHSVPGGRTGAEMRLTADLNEPMITLNDGDPASCTAGSDVDVPDCTRPLSVWVAATRVHAGGENLNAVPVCCCSMSTIPWK